MKTSQTNKLAMYRSVQGLLQVATETSGIAALPARLTAFVTQIATIDELDRAQNMPTHGRVKDRDARLRELIDLTLELAGYARSYARDHGLNDLEAQVTVSPSDFRRLRVTRRPVLAQQIEDAIVPMAEQLADYGVTAETLAGFRAAIATAKAAVREPRSTVTEKRTATLALAKAFAEADDMLETHIDSLLFPLQKTHPEFYAEYRAKREVLERPGQVSGPTPTDGANSAAASVPSAPPQSTTAQLAA